MNEMGADEGLPELPPMGHPLQKLGARLGELLDEDHWAECERLLLEGWAHDEIDRETGRHWQEFILTAMCIKPACMPGCSDCNSAISGDRIREFARRYAYLRLRSLNEIDKGGVFAGMTPANVVLNGCDLDNAIDAAIEQQANAD